MVIKVFISGISASKEVKKHQLRAQFLLDSYKIKFETVDITDPTQESSREKMLTEAKRRNDANPPQPPQFFNEEEYCGDFEDLETANDNDELFKFLKLGEDISMENGNVSEGEDDLFVPPGEKKEEETPPEEAPKEEEEKKEGENEDEEVKQEVVEQVTINGVVYDIPPDRKLEVGGRIIDVDELLAQEGEEVDLDDVDEALKENIKPKGEDEEGEEDEAMEKDGDDENKEDDEKAEVDEEEEEETKPKKEEDDE